MSARALRWGFALLLLFCAVLAEAQNTSPSGMLSLTPSEEYATVVLRGASATGQKLQVSGDVLVLALDKAPKAAENLLLKEDKTIASIAVELQPKPMLRIQLRDSALPLEKLAEKVEPVTEADALRIMLPRALPKVVSVAQEPQEKPSVSLSSSKTNRDLPVGYTASENSATYRNLLILLAFVVGSGCLVLWAKRRQVFQLNESERIRVLDTLVISPKAKVMLLSAREREFLVSVAENGTQLLGQWGKQLSEDDEEMTPGARIARMVSLSQTGTPIVSAEHMAAQAVSFPEPRPKAQPAVTAITQTSPQAPVQAVPQAPVTPPSPAVAGLLKLRQNNQITQAMPTRPRPQPPAPVDDPIANELASDNAWSREYVRLSTKQEIS